MEHLILSTSVINDLIELLPNSEVININDFKPNNNEYSTLRQISGQDVIPHHIAYNMNKLLGFGSVESIIIDLAAVPLSLGILLGAHLRFLEGLKFSGPIIFISDSPLKVLQDKSWITELGGLNNYFLEKGFELISRDKAKEITFDKNESQCSGLYASIEKYFGSSIVPQELKNIQIVPPSKVDSRHSIANQWGAVRLANNCGYNSEEIKYEVPNSLYFKYLNSKYGGEFAVSEEFRKKRFKDFVNDNGQIDFSKKHEKLKILLIDDNAEKGWINFLRLVFPSSEIIVETEWGPISNLKHGIYHLIFLDWYQENSSKQSRELLKSLKNNHVQTPIIIFTASNKYWTYEEVLNLGADGVYVKESPEYAHDADLSRENFENFVSIVGSVLNKYSTLRQYWESIRKIKNGIRLPEKTFKGKNTVIRERVKERLEMFYGLLKRGFEQRQYNLEKFHLSENTLAFITLWSILNEISEACYDKTDYQNKALIKSKNGRFFEIIPQANKGQYSNWKIVGTDDKYLIKHDYELSYSEKGELDFFSDGVTPKTKVKSSQSFLAKDNSTYYIPKEPEDRNQVTKEIGSQIAYLILNSDRLSTEIKEKLCEDLCRLNDVRNKLYLTHGDDIKSDFYFKIIKYNNEDVSEVEIKDLFVLISYLLIGRD
jgi:DNA-binding NarL/FixJ family response regulator